MRHDTHGERIGRITIDGRPLSETHGDVMRFNTGRYIQNLIMVNVLAGVGDGHELIQVSDREGLEFYHDIYARPPIDDPAEAQRLGGIIHAQLHKANLAYPGERFRPEEMDTFTPEQSEQTA